MGTLEARAEDVKGDLVCVLCSVSIVRGLTRECRAECDPTGTGGLDLEGFIHGMWRIDEELRRAQLRSGLGLGLLLGRHPSGASVSGIARDRARASRAQPIARLLLR